MRSSKISYCNFNDCVFDTWSGRGDLNPESMVVKSIGYKNLDTF